MSFAPHTSHSPRKTDTYLSTWTPLNHKLSNDMVFEERRALLGKWFDKWTDTQRKQVMLDFFSSCSLAQLRFLRRHLCSHVHDEIQDFTAILPRVLSLYIYSFLDPRSLCRCSQVSWHWNSLVEMDQLWMPKCLRLGWCLDFTPSPFERGMWKRHYIEMVYDLHVTKPKKRWTASQGFVLPERKGIERERLMESQPRGEQSVQQQPPWRSPDKHPTDTLRYNYLQNCGPMLHTSSAQEISSSRKNSNAAYKLRKAKALMLLKPSRPDWATNTSQEYPVTMEIANQLSQSMQWNAGIRPGPVTPPVPRMSKEGLKAVLRTQRSIPTVPLFDELPQRLRKTVNN